MNKVDSCLELLGNEDLCEIMGGTFAKDVGYALGYSARWNYEFIRGWIEYLS